MVVNNLTLYKDGKNLIASEFEQKKQALLTELERLIAETGEIADLSAPDWGMPWGGKH